MLSITIPTVEDLWDPVNNEFLSFREKTITLEHSLVSISKWEAKWKKPFLDSQKTDEELIDYIKCMTITQNVDEMAYNFMTDENINKISDYIGDSMTATKFYSIGGKKPKRKIYTSEEIYYLMIRYGIPFECQKWHINRLLALIKVCDLEENPGEKMSTNEILQYNRMENERRKAAYNTKG